MVNEEVIDFGIDFFKNVPLLENLGMFEEFRGKFSDLEHTTTNGTFRLTGRIWGGNYHILIFNEHLAASRPDSQTPPLDLPGYVAGNTLVPGERGIPLFASVYAELNRRGY